MIIHNNWCATLIIDIFESEIYVYEYQNDRECEIDVSMLELLQIDLFFRGVAAFCELRCQSFQLMRQHCQHLLGLFYFIFFLSISYSHSHKYTQTKKTITEINMK